MTQTKQQNEVWCELCSIKESEITRAYRIEGLKPNQYTGDYNMHVVCGWCFEALMSVEDYTVIDEWGR
jgi:hypothetical protein